LHDGLEQHDGRLSHDEQSWYDWSFDDERQGLSWLPYFSV
jgi:hypothetical protein